MRGERPTCRWVVAGMSCATRPSGARDEWSGGGRHRWRRRWAAEVAVRRARAGAQPPPPSGSKMCTRFPSPLRDGAERSAICPPPDPTDPVAADVATDAAVGRYVGHDKRGFSDFRDSISFLCHAAHINITRRTEGGAR